ncbi:MAG: hypothetical protein HUJ51_01845 [Eggerthellaceae bacterium]|nr:hypothetical protein [Eggerthellaceae bacterium]
MSKLVVLKPNFRLSACNPAWLLNILAVFFGDTTKDQLCDYDNKIVASQINIARRSR